MGGFCSVTILMDHGRCFPQHSACVLPRACHIFSSVRLYKNDPLGYIRRCSFCHVGGAILRSRDLKQVSRGMSTWTTRLHKGGLPHAVQSAEEVASPDLVPIGPQAKSPSTGMLSRLPMVPPAAEHIASAMKRSERVKPNMKLKNELQRVRNQATRRMDTLAKEVSVPLGTIIRGFPPREQMHPFEQALVLLTIGPEAYERRLVQVDALRRSTLEVGKSYTALVAKAKSKKEVLATVDEGIAKVVSVYNKGAKAVDDLKDMVKALRRLPVVDPVLPTVALVGAPNVGKSSLVQVLSSGVPEVCNYPFTTRSIKMGHFFVDGRRHQVTDTPGLLARADGDRNAMENLTLACLAHLPTSVLFVMDLTGECGTSLENQWAIRQYLKARFPKKPWLDVFSKGDLVMPAGRPQKQARAQAEPQQGLPSPEDSCASNSSHTGGLGGESLEGRGEHVERCDSRARQGAAEPSMASGQTNPSFLDSREGAKKAGALHAASPLSEPGRTPVEESTGGVAVEDIPICKADFLRLLPDAVVVSSKTRKGLDVLKERVLTMLGFPEWEV